MARNIYDAKWRRTVRHQATRQRTAAQLRSRARSIEQDADSLRLDVYARAEDIGETRARTDRLIADGQRAVAQMEHEARTLRARAAELEARGA